MSNNDTNINNRRNHGFFRPRFIQDLLRNIGPHFNAQGDDEDTDMPGLEPIDNAVNPLASSSHVPESTSQLPSATGANRRTDDDSDSIPDLQSVSNSSESESEGDADEVEMMPDLQPIDDDNDSAWTDDDNTSRRFPDELPVLEPAGSRPQVLRSSNRRARVDDDDDEDRDRRHPSQRTSNDEPNDIDANNQHHQSPPQPLPIPQHPQFRHPINIPGFVHIVSRGPLLGTNPDGTPDTFQLFQRLFGGATLESNPNPLPPQQPENPTVNTNTTPAFAGGFTITLGTGPFHLEPGGPHPHDHADTHADTDADADADADTDAQHSDAHANIRAQVQQARAMAQQARAQAQQARAQAQQARAHVQQVHAHVQQAQARAQNIHPHPPGPGARDRPEDTVDVAMFAELMARFGVGLGQALGIARDDREDPERAKKLVEGLEQVPFGLVRRLEKVGGAPGGHVDTSVVAGASETVSEPGCAICWDRLLDAEGSGFAMQQDGETEKVETEVEGVTADRPPMPSATEPQIISLPCAHVFHASCLLPWFSRPMQTTCPTCRFNVDPENLTFVRRPRPLRRHEPPAPGDENANGVGTDANDDTGEGDENVGTHPGPGMHVHIVELNGHGGPPTTQPVFPAPLAEPVQAQTPENSDGRPPNPNSNPNSDGEFWTFGIDMIFEEERPENEDNNDVDMENDDSNDPGTRQAQDFAQQFMGQMGGQNIFTHTPAPAADAVPNPTETPVDHTTGTDGPGPDPGVQFTQFIGMNGNGAFIAGPGDIMQMFQGVMGGTGTNGPAGAAPAQAVGENMPTGNAQAAFAQLFGGVLAVPQDPHGHTPGPPPLPQKKTWSPPPAPGPTLRQRVEQREREAGLRCFDMSCGLGPSDEEPYVSVTDTGMKQLSIRPSRNNNNLATGMGTSVCSHTFHPSCLVSAVRVSLQGADEDVLGDEVEVSCPSCRAVGSISKEEWEEGAKALL